jgi:glycosyltransferase involved in cell wall biosynthesis
MDILILQPHIPHYREEFFKKISEKKSVGVYCYNSDNDISDNDFQKGNFVTNIIKTYKFGPFMWYNPFKFIQNESDTLVLMLDFKHLSTWFLLVTSIMHKKKIILWGQGISIKRYLKDEKKALNILKWMLQLADGVWFYTEKEKVLWERRIPNLNSVALNNTISDIDRITEVSELESLDIKILKKKMAISQPIILIFCARFTKERRVDLLLEIIEKLNPEQFGFIIIGEGNYKPCFKKYSNVYDYGKVYGFEAKKELFAIADIYFQPAWLGLSVVEAMAYAKPIFSFKRSKEVLQCVEYYYVQDNFNGKIFDDTMEMISYLNGIQLDTVKQFGINAKKFVEENLSMDAMVTNALKII